MTCELCKGTGFYGDLGPGIRGNSEYARCEACKPKPIKQPLSLKSRLTLAEALIETIENVYPDICEMAQYREWKEGGK